MRSLRIVLCAALLLTGSLWLADSALAKPAYCDCDYCPEATHYKSCTDPVNHNVYDYLDWCYSHCFQEFNVASGSEPEVSLSTEVQCNEAPAAAELPTAIDLPLQPASP